MNTLRKYWPRSRRWKTAQEWPGGARMEGKQRRVVERQLCHNKELSPWGREKSCSGGSLRKNGKASFQEFSERIPRPYQPRNVEICGPQLGNFQNRFSFLTTLSFRFLPNLNLKRLFSEISRFNEDIPNLFEWFNLNHPWIRIPAGGSVFDAYSILIWVRSAGRWTWTSRAVILLSA